MSEPVTYPAQYITKPTGRVEIVDLDNQMTAAQAQLDALIAEHERAGTDPGQDTRYLMAAARARQLIREGDELAARLGVE